MKNKRIPITGILTACMLFTGCVSKDSGNSSKSELSANNSTSDSSVTESTVEINAGIVFSGGYKYLDFSERYENIRNEYPDKTILIWAIDSNIRYENELNKYLSDNGFGYVICFKDYSYNDMDYIGENGEWTTSYYELLNEDINNGEQIDIISTGHRYTGYDAFTNTYQHFSAAGLLEPINGYLSDTAEGAKLKDQVPESYWKSLELDGKIYGFDGAFTCLGNSAGYSLNAELCDEFGIDTGEFRGSYEDTLNLLLEVCKNNNWQFSVRYFDSMEYYCDYDFVTPYVYIDENGSASNIYENADVKNLFNIVQKGFDENIVITGLPAELKNYFGQTSYGALGAYSRDGVRTSKYFGLSSLSSKEDEQSAEAYTVYPQKYKTIHSATQAVGICSASQNKDIAFEALAEVMTNSELNNLIAFGTEYETVDGCVHTGGYYDTSIANNMLIRLPLEGVQSPEMHDRIKDALESAEMSPFAGFCFDVSAVSQQLIEVEKVVNSVSGEFPSEKYSSGEEYLEELNKRLYDAGLQDILDEINGQLEEFK